MRLVPFFRSFAAAVTLLGIIPATRAEKDSGATGPVEQLPIVAHLRLANMHAHFSEMSEGLLAAENQQKSIEHLRDALAALEKSGTREQIAYVRQQLGIALVAKSRSSPLTERDSILAEAEAHIRAAEVFTLEKYPVEHAIACDNLSTVLHARAQQPAGHDAARRTAWLNESRESARQALAIFESRGRKIDALRVRLNIIAISADQPGDSPANLEEAIRELEAIVADPKLGKRSRNRGYAHRLLAGKLIAVAESNLATSGPRLDRAEELLLEVPGTRTSEHRSWGFVEGLFGRIEMARSILPQADQAAHLKKSLGHFNEALGVFTRESSPMEWSSLSLCRGLTVAMLAGTGCDNERYKLTDGLIEVFEAQNFMDSNPEARQERNALIEMLKNPKAAANPAAPTPASTESPTLPQK
jgi:hypothetical protein